MPLLTLQKLEKRESFIRNLRKTMIADEEQNGGTIIDSQVGAFLTEDGQLTQAFRSELKNISAAHLKALETKMETTRVPTADTFGIKRRFCTVCETECPGYTGSSLLFSANS